MSAARLKLCNWAEGRVYPFRHIRFGPCEPRRNRCLAKSCSPDGCEITFSLTSVMCRAVSVFETLRRSPSAEPGPAETDKNRDHDEPTDPEVGPSSPPGLTGLFIKSYRASGHWRLPAQRLHFAGRETRTREAGAPTPDSMCQAQPPVLHKRDLDLSNCQPEPAAPKGSSIHPDSKRPFHAEHPQPRQLASDTRHPPTRPSQTHTH